MCENERKKLGLNLNPTRQFHFARWKPLHYPRTAVAPFSKQLHWGTGSRGDASSITTIFTFSSLVPTVIYPACPHNIHLLLPPWKTLTTTLPWVAFRACIFFSLVSPKLWTCAAISYHRWNPLNFTKAAFSICDSRHIDKIHCDYLSLGW